MHALDPAPPRLLIALLLVLPLAGAPACDRIEARLDGGGAPERPNLLLVSIDTLRADHLGAYGYERDTSPRLDALAAASTRYAKALAPAPWTLPSHAAMLTGRHPQEIGIMDRWATLPPEVPGIAEYLTPGGYQSVGFVDETTRGWIGAARGFSRGFDHWRHLPEENGDRHYDAARTADAVIEWLEERDTSRPFFVFAHTKSVHAIHAGDQSAGTAAYPYNKPRPYLERFASPEQLAIQWHDADLGKGVTYLRSFNEGIAAGALDAGDLGEERVRALQALYDAGIYYVDEQIGRILDALERLGLREDTIIVVTSDHGEAFLEHHLLLHKEVYDQLLRVPLIVHVPGRSPTVVQERVTLMDVVPMLLELASLPRPTDLPPRSEKREHFAYYRDREGYYTESYALRGPKWTLILTRAGDGNFQPELYRADDPLQQLRVDDRPEVVARMMGRLQKRIARAPVQTGVSIELDSTTLEHLRALGYVE